jgi:hypothetical protein
MKFNSSRKKWEGVKMNVHATEEFAKAKHFIN